MAIGRTADSLLSDLLSAVAAAGATDLHVSTGHLPTLRVDGGLQAVGGVAAPSGEEMAELVGRILGTERTAQFFTKRQEVDLAFDPREGSVRFRVNVYWSRREPAVALRTLPRTIPALSELNLPEDLYELTERRQGFVLITGPSGHGKTTTMASLVNYINQTRPVHIITIEDPIEYTFTEVKALIHQREVGVDSVSFPEALRSVLREDPNVVVIGEMRDLETIATALTVAETGHLVFATLHTNDAAQTIDRIVDVFPAQRQSEVRVQLAATLTGVISLRLLPRSGQRGRIPAAEVLIATPAVRNLIREGETAQIPGLVQTGRTYGMVTLEQSVRELITRGEVLLDEVLPFVPSLVPQEGKELT